MPSRVIDYTALWTSQKLEQCPIWARREYPWLYGLADVNGSFEITNVRALWMQVAPIRPDLTLDLLRKIFHEYHRRGVLFTWQVRRKWFGHWTSSDKPGRLPRFSQRKRFRWYAPAVPKKALRLYANRFAHKQISGDVDTLPRRGRVPSVGGGSKGIGDSNSKGKGKGKGKREAARKARAASSPLPATQASGLVKGLQFHYIGKKLNVTKSTHILLDETFGHALNLEQVYKEADLWLVRTGKGRPSVLKFLGNWCKKELPKPQAKKEAVVGRGPQSEGPPGKCQECGREIPHGFVRCYACAEGGNP